jgi:phage baseplate assembly protein W|tara:strand:- start:5001 stop:5396 length:396 start_codon:yes stop_codon:yes gene_type:complete
MNVINNSMARLIGFNTIGKTKAPFTTTGAETVLRDLQNELYTKKGERVMRPNFGCIIWDLLMDPATSEVEKLAKEDIQRILNRDPRVSEKEVKVLVLDNSISAEVIIDVIPFNSVETLYLTYTQQMEEGIS